MRSTAWIKRLIPFVATFAVGVFIASFFVDVGASGDRCRRGKKRHEMQRLRVEIDELRNENLRLRNSLESGHSHVVRDLEMNHEFEAPDLEGLSVPPPPIAPKDSE
ncbi:MAG: hypothetical protein IPM59_02240 [Chloracidobacterium sp.]|nr:hypothetical protein [Chloracidobacterium sp.]